MKYKELQINGEEYTDQRSIESFLKEHKFYWIIDAEFENAVLEIKNNTIIWHEGDWFNGIWEYGIWISGTFHGKWMNGIFENGEFKGEWISGINNTKYELN